MKQFFKFIPFISGLALFSGCKEIVLYQSKVNSPVKIDGKIQEWNDKDFVSLEDSIAKLGYTKDEKYIYISGITTNKDIIRQAVFAGLTLYIDPSGEENKDLQMDVKFPRSKRIDYYKGGFFAALSDNQKKTVLQKIDSLKLGVTVTDVKTNKTINFPEGRDNAFAGKMYSSRDTLMFEVKIPIAINELFPAKQPLTGRSVFGITSLPMVVSGFANRAGPYNMMGDDRMNGGERRREEEVRQPDKLEVWFKIGGGENE